MGSLLEFFRTYGPLDVLTREGSPVVLDLPEVDDGSDSETDDWYVLKGEPWVCSCGASKPYMAEDSHPHRVIVWPTPTDPNLKKLAARMLAEDGERAEVVPYEMAMGSCVSFYQLSPS